MTLRELRMANDLSLGELARKAGLETSVLSMFERGYRLPKPEQITAIASALGCLETVVLTSLPSADEVAKNKDDRMERVVAAMNAVATDAKAKGLKKGNGGKSFVRCPNCGGQLLYSVATLNGHIWGQCQTDNCAAWMQ